jgi:hypothetical protein
MSIIKIESEAATTASFAAIPTLAVPFEALNPL